jgi:hypothetical protein
MPDEYLWDGTGDPDPEIVRLEAQLARYRGTGSKGPGRGFRLAMLSLAAGLMLAAALAYWLKHAPASDWQLAGKNIAVGQTIETGGQDGLEIESAAVGRVSLDRDSRLQILTSNSDHQQFALLRGTMHALIWAPPARFVVETPSAKTIDLGCAYTLTVQDDGSGLVTVQTGWVAFQDGSRESFIPAGAECRTLPRLGPGLPYFESASQTFREAVWQFDGTGRSKELETIVREARKEDALTLWHLIPRTDGRDREMVVTRFASLIPGVDEPGLLAGNSAAEDGAWNLLGLGDTDWWRMWKASFRTASPRGR